MSGETVRDTCPKCGGAFCPKCGAHLLAGHGLMGGGFGPYSVCENEACDFFDKQQECPLCEALLDGKGACEDCGSAEEIAEKRKPTPRCGACMRPTETWLPDGRCGNICGDGLPCAGDGDGTEVSA